MFEEKSNLYIDRHEKVLQHIIESHSIPALRIREAIKYSLFPGGKRLRPLLVYFCGELFESDISCLDAIAAAIELTHCYSLIHDDLPAMDNDDFRRGKPSCHKAFDEATAILAGDGLQVLAIEVLLAHLPKILSAAQTLAVTQELLHASGVSGMVSGQSLDLSELTQPHFDETKLLQIHHLKTGKLISACINMVLTASNPQEEQILALQQFSHLLGLVFQMHDDYMDYYANPEILGKCRSSDSANGKLTYASLYSKDVLSIKINELYQEARAALNPFGSKNAALIALIDTLENR
jgi:farnesyl diphosphate synthase